MSRSNNSYKSVIYFLILLLAAVSVSAQKVKQNKDSNTAPILWESVKVSHRNLFLGPGGVEMQPDLSNITFIKAETGGHSKKFKIKDGSGRIWVAKVGDEAQSETAAVRLVWALGYKTEINYLVPKLMIPGQGVFTNVRLEARPTNIDRKKNWNWKKNPFLDTTEFQGLKIMMAFLNNWDLKEVNNVILQNSDSDETYYVISDLGVTFGSLGSNSLPIFWRIGRSRNKPTDYAKGKFIKGVKNDELKIFYRGKNKSIFNDIKLDDGIWLAKLLNQLSDRQISDAFRAANYSGNDLALLTQTVRKRISELDRFTSMGIAGK